MGGSIACWALKLEVIKTNSGGLHWQRLLSVRITGTAEIMLTSLYSECIRQSNHEVHISMRIGARPEVKLRSAQRSAMQHWQ
jgi:hypothetical protein